MGRILRVDATAGDAYADVSFAGNPSTYLEFCVYFPSALLDDATVQANWVDILDIYGLFGGAGFLDGLFLSFDETPSAGWQWWWDIGAGGPAGTVTPDEWHTIKWRLGDDGYRHLIIDGVEFVNGVIGNAGAANRLTLGTTAFGAYPGEWYYDDVTVGTSSFGSSDIFSDDFESGDLSAWDSTTGAATNISDGVTGGGCGGGAGGVTVSLSPSTLVIVAGGSDTTAVTVGGVTESVDLAASGAPAGVSLGFSSDPVSAPGSSTLTVTVAGGTAPGTYSITVTGTGSASSDSATLTLLVPAGENTTCATALVISGTSGSTVADNSGANDFVFATDPLFNDPCFGFGYGGGGPLWWRYTNPFTRAVILRIRIGDAGAGSIERALFGIFRGSCDAFVPETLTTTDGFGRTFGGLGYIGDADVPSADPDVDYVEVAVASGETVFIEVDGYSGDTTDPVTLGAPNRGLFELSWVVLSISARDAIEASVLDGAGLCAANGDSYNEPSSVVDAVTNIDPRARSDDYVEFDSDSWYTTAYDTNNFDTVTARVFRWNGSSVTAYELPLSGDWGQAEILLCTDGTTVYAVALENGGPDGVGWPNPSAGRVCNIDQVEPEFWQPYYPAVFAYNAGGDAFEKIGVMEPRCGNAISLIQLETPTYVGRIGAIDATAHASMPGRVYVVWAERGADSTFTCEDVDETYWNEHMAIGCFGTDAPFSEFDVGFSTCPLTDAGVNSGNVTEPRGNDPWYVPRQGYALLANDQEVCQFFHILAVLTGLADFVSCEQVEDAGSLTPKIDIEYEQPPGSSAPGSLGGSGSDGSGYANGLALEPECHGETALDSAIVWGFVRQGDAFPGNRPDWTILPLLGVSGVLWRDIDPTFTASDLTDTRTAGFRAGIWTNADSGQSAASFVAQASALVDDFAPDILVLDVETRYGTDPSANWTWHEDVMSALRAAYPDQAFAVTMGPLKDDFNYAAYTSRSVEAWPQSYPASIADCSYDPVVVFDRVVANGVDPSLIAPVLSADCYPAHVAILAAAGRTKWSVFTLDDRPEYPASGSSATETETLRTLFVTWNTDDGLVHFAYNLAPLLDSPERWFNDNAQGNGNDVTVNPFANSVRPIMRTLYRDRFGETWGFSQAQGAVFFDRHCDREWTNVPNPRQDEASGTTQAMVAARQVVWNEPSDIVRSATRYETAGNLWHLAIAHMQILREWRICDIGDEIEDTLRSGTPFILVEFLASHSEASPASPTDFSPDVHLSMVKFKT